MKKKIFYLILTVFGTLFIYGCRSDRSKEEHDHTTALCENQLFVEVYKISSGGAHGGDRVSDYLTDSSTFRIYIGTFDNANGGYSFTCKGDSVYVYEVEQKPLKNEILSTKGYSISDLKNKKIKE